MMNNKLGQEGREGLIRDAAAVLDGGVGTRWLGWLGPWFTGLFYYRTDGSPMTAADEQWFPFREAALKRNSWSAMTMARTEPSFVVDRLGRLGRWPGGILAP